VVFIAMLVHQDPLHYKCLLDILAHTVQYLEIKPGIAIGLVGKQGTGKSFLWSIIERLIGKQPHSGGDTISLLQGVQHRQLHALLL
jgi:ABC-type glutathione transport system ATPase component